MTHIADPADAAGKIVLWLESVLDGKMEQWVDLYFTDAWHREILKCVYRFFQKRGNRSDRRSGPPFDDILGNGLRLMILMVAMGQQIYIPDDAKKDIEDQFPGLVFPSGYVSPRMVNMLVKSVMVVMVLNLSEVVCSGLDGALNSGNEEL
jgi:hypothetical protein